jgi:hypothetical protein
MRIGTLRRQQRAALLALARASRAAMSASQGFITVKSLKLTSIRKQKKRQTPNYSLICCERKILYHD